MIILDTHIWIWWVNGDTSMLKPLWKTWIESADVVGVSAISCFEVAWLERHGRIALSCARDEWFALALQGSGVTLLPITPEISGVAVDLTEHHSDPQDRIIIATALAYDGKLLSLDRKLRDYRELSSRLLP